MTWSRDPRDVAARAARPLGLGRGAAGSLTETFNRLRAAGASGPESARSVVLVT